jgi:adenosylcobinamide-GDP ribazoletransferase
MMTYRGGLRRVAADLRISVLFSTRLPLVHSFAIAGADIARASWALPLAGALVGLFGAIAYWLVHAAGLPPFPASVLALAVTLVATGCLHEDGLADTADGFGGGATRERKLEIMRDSRIGSYGTCALLLSLLLRASALASLAEPALVAGALVAANACGRATMPVLMWLVPNARADGLSADAGRPPATSTTAAVILGVIALGLGLNLGAAIGATLLLIAAVAFVAALSRKQIGGQTGDVLGALEQVSEIIVLLVAAAAQT